MSYVKRTDLQAGEGETVVELDSGSLVAVSCTRKSVESGMAYHAVARAIDAQGESLFTSTLQPVMSEHKHTFTPEKLAELGDPVIMREMLYIVLGEPATLSQEFSVPLIPISNDVRAAKSIVRHIEESSLQGAADPGSVL